MSLPDVSKSQDVYYFLGNIVSHISHAMPLYDRIGGTFVVTSHEAEQRLIKLYNVPTVCLDDVPHTLTWRPGLHLPHRNKNYITIGDQFKKTIDFLNQRARIVIFYELYDFTGTRLDRPRTLFLTHGNMLKNYMKMHPDRLKILDQYDYMAALGPAIHEEFLEMGIDESKLVKLGVSRTDLLVKYAGKIHRSESINRLVEGNPLPIISYLPTFWGPSSIYASGLNLLRNFPSDSHVLLFKPHPQTPKKILKPYIDYLSTVENIIYLDPDTKITIEDILAASSVIIGDTSSVMLDAILLEKPLIFAESSSEIFNESINYSVIQPIIDYSESININTNDVLTAIESAVAKGVDLKIWRQVKQSLFYDINGESTKKIAEFVANAGMGKR